MGARWNNLPGTCKCSHRPHAGLCPFYPCGCKQYRDKAEYDAAQQRHPAGRDLPQTADIEDYLRAKGELA